MIYNKKGLSAVVVTLIMILLGIVVAGIIWVVVRNVAQGGTEEIGLGAKCLEVDVVATKAECTQAGSCNVTVERNAGGDDLGGLKLIFNNASGEQNYVHDVSGNINPLETTTEEQIATGLVNVTSVDVTPYFTSESGNEQLCSGSTSYDDVNVV